MSKEEPTHVKHIRHGFFTDCGAFGCTAIVCYSWGHWIGGTIALIVMCVIAKLESIEEEQE